MFKDFPLPLWFWWSVLAGVWALLFLGVLTPETGFDAVWYHLPIIKTIATAGHLVYLPNLYQSVNPLLGEIILSSGWLVAGELGVKAVAYLVALVSLALAYPIARRWLSPTWSVVSLVLITLIQPFAWQTSSAYVDVIKATWELGMLWLMFKYLESRGQRWLFLASLCLGASLGTKLFSLALVPLWLMWLVWVKPKQRWEWLVSLAGVVLPALPFYWWAWLNTGHPFLSLALHTQKLTEISGTPTMAAHLWHQLLWFWSSPIELLLSRDYVNWLVVLTLPLLLSQVKHWWPNQSSRLALSLVATQWLIWWFLPPLSTRYALSGFMVLVILTLRVLSRLSSRSRSWSWAIGMAVALSLVFHVAPRLVVANRQLPYLLGQQTKTEYLTQFLDGNIDKHLRSWHQF